MDEKFVYILLTRTNSLFSRVIHLVTGDMYTHSALGVDGCSGEFYGFGRRFPRLPFPGCFHKELPWKLRHVMPCRIYGIPVSSESYERLSSLLHTMYEERERYHYNIAGVIALWLGMPKPRLRKHHFFCSQFVIWALKESGCISTSFSPEEVRPESFRTLPGVTLVYEGIPSHRQSICCGMRATAYK